MEEKELQKTRELKWSAGGWFGGIMGASIWQAIIVPLFLRNGFPVSGYVTIGSIAVIVLAGVVLFVLKDGVSYLKAFKYLLNIVFLCYFISAVAYFYDSSYYLLNMSRWSVWMIPAIPLIIEAIFMFTQGQKAKEEPRQEPGETELPGQEKEPKEPDQHF